MVEEARDIIVTDTEYETAVVGEDVLLTPHRSDEQTEQRQNEDTSLQEAGDALPLSLPCPSPPPPSSSTPYLSFAFLSSCCATVVTLLGALTLSPSAQLLHLLVTFPASHTSVQAL